jgi:hypothetical protein
MKIKTLFLEYSLDADDIGLSAKERARYRADRIADDLA